MELARMILSLKITSKVSATDWRASNLSQDPTLKAEGEKSYAPNFPGSGDVGLVEAEDLTDFLGETCRAEAYSPHVGIHQAKQRSGHLANRV